LKPLCWIVRGWNAKGKLFETMNTQSMYLIPSSHYYQ